MLRSLRALLARLTGAGAPRAVEMPPAVEASPAVTAQRMAEAPGGAETPVTVEALPGVVVEPALAAATRAADAPAAVLVEAVVGADAPAALDWRASQAQGDQAADAPLAGSAPAEGEPEGQTALAAAAGTAAASPVASEPDERARAHDLLTAGKVERAIVVLENALRSHPDEEMAAMLDEMRTIRRTSKSLRKRPRDPYAHFELGRALFAQECGEEALAHLEQACRLRPAWLEPHLLRAYELHWQRRWREAEAAYLAVLGLDPNHLIARRGLNAVRICQPPDALMPPPQEALGSPGSLPLTISNVH